MKKTFALAFIFALLSFSIYAEKNLISISVGLNTGIPFYGSAELNEATEDLDASKRFVFGAYGLFNLNIIEHASVFTGAELFTDLNWADKNYANHLHVDFPLGLRLSPNLGGLAFGTAYLLGFRSDFYYLPEEEKSNSMTSWGNGFKLFLEYDFSYHGSEFLPTVGISWSIMPRGNYDYDNLLNLYMGLNF
ncbi:MAG: hypothetical protein K5681_03115 [Treponema sp.]|nr:hypothetical protein [Treponema sp.]